LKNNNKAIISGFRISYANIDMPSITLLISQPIDIKKSKVMEALHAVRNLILYALNDPII
jgi:hypothetical protein